MKKILLLVAILTTTLITMAQTYRASDRKSQQEILNDKYCSGLFKNADGTILDIQSENVQAFFNILDWLEGRVAGLQVYVGRSGVRIPVIRGNAASIFVDEMRVDANFLNSLSVNDIAMVKVIKGPFVGAIGNGPGGAIAIYTIRGEDEEEEEQ